MDDDENISDDTTLPVRRKRKNKPGAGRPPVHLELDLGKALKFRMQGLSYGNIAKLMGVSEVTCSTRLRTFIEHIGDPHELLAYRANEEGLVAGVGRKLLTNISRMADEQKGSMSENTLAFGVLFDKRRLLENKSTSNVNTLTRIIEEAADGKE